jgi:hypothetical protein
LAHVIVGCQGFGKAGDPGVGETPQQVPTTFTAARASIKKLASRQGADAADVIMTLITHPQ